MKKTFRPEFLNRIDEIIVFQQLTREEIRRIVVLMSADLQSRIKSQGMELVVTDECKDLIAKEGYNPTYGARPLRRAIQRMLEDNMAEQVLMGKFKEGDIIITKLEGDSVVFEKTGKTVEKPAENKENGGDKADKVKSEKTAKSSKKSSDGDAEKSEESSNN